MAFLFAQDFNSSMVRLRAHGINASNNRYQKFQFQYGAIKRLNKGIYFRMPYLFQFQYGAIKRSLVIARLCGVNEFQFQYGAIKSKILHHIYHIICDFNSSMVRLRDNSVASTDCFFFISIPVWCD